MSKRVVPQGGKTVEGTLLGTLNYMSPEQAQGREVNHLTDLWAMGVIAYESLVGSRPFDEEAPGALVLQICMHPIPVPSQVNPNVPGDFDAWFATACNRDPSKRFQSAQDLSRALADICDAEQLSIDDVVAIPANKPITEELIRSPAQGLQVGAPPAPNSRKRRVLQIVDSMPPPAPDMPPPASEQTLQLMPSDPPEEVEIELEPEPDYFVRHNQDTVGPLTIEALRAGYVRGHLIPSALVWSHGWSAWKAARDVMEPFPDKPGPAVTDGILLMGPQAETPAGAPVPPASLGAMTLAAAAAAVRRAPASAPRTTDQPANTMRAGSREPLSAPVSAVRTSPGKNGAKEPEYFVTDGKISVGPVRASVLRVGIEQGKVSESALAWRQGWTEWKSVSDLGDELQTWKAAPASVLKKRPGIEAVGMKSLPPPTAPPSVSPNRREHSK